MLTLTQKIKKFFGIKSKEFFLKGIPKPLIPFALFKPGELGRGVGDVDKTYEKFKSLSVKDRTHLVFRLGGERRPFFEALNRQVKQLIELGIDANYLEPDQFGRFLFEFFLNEDIGENNKGEWEELALIILKETSLDKFFAEQFENPLNKWDLVDRCIDKGFSRILETLSKHSLFKPWLDSKNYKDKPPLIHAILISNLEAATVLLRAGADPNGLLKKDSHKQSALHLTLWLLDKTNNTENQKVYEFFETLLDFGADPYLDLSPLPTPMRFARNINLDFSRTMEIRYKLREDYLALARLRDIQLNNKTLGKKKQRL